MPGGDRTGPIGAGPLTGHRAGHCAGYGVPGFANPAPGYGGLVGNRGWGRGWRHWFYATGVPGWRRPGEWPRYMPPTEEQELAFLKEEAKGLQEQLEAINRRIEELEKKE